MARLEWAAPVVLFYFASPAGNIAGRASVIAFFLATDLIGLAFQWSESLVTRAALVRVLIFMPALFAGVWIGARRFKAADPAKFRNWVLLFLALLAVLTGLRGVLALE